MTPIKVFHLCLVACLEMMIEVLQGYFFPTPFNQNFENRRTKKAEKRLKTETNY